ncbi:MAG: transcriptional regulator [Betaproteobacteria bacterium]|nr:transcriptional regulator [Betaproteobacteria bacterium]
MELKPINTKLEYKAALKQAEAWWDASAGSANAAKLEVLTLLIEDYESRHFAIEAPDPIDFLHFVMEQRGLTRKDLEPHIGSRARVAEVLNRVRPLSLEMIRNLSEGLDLPAEVLVRRYELAVAA